MSPRLLLYFDFDWFIYPFYSLFYFNFYPILCHIIICLFYLGPGWLTCRFIIADNGHEFFLTAVNNVVVVQICYFLRQAFFSNFKREGKIYGARETYRPIAELVVVRLRLNNQMKKKNECYFDIFYSLRLGDCLSKVSINIRKWNLWWSWINFYNRINEPFFGLLNAIIQRKQ